MNEQESNSCELQVIQPGPQRALNTIYYQLSKTISQERSSNVYNSLFRLFQVPSNAQLKFFDTKNFKASYGQVIKTCYIFKFQYPHSEGYTHGIYMAVNGYARRCLFNRFIEEAARIFVGSMISLKAAVPHIKRNMSLFDYLQSLFVHPHNLIVNFSHQHDVLSETMFMQKLNHRSVSNLKDKIFNSTSEILDNIITMPGRYQHSYLSSVISLSVDQFRKHMRQTNFSEFVFKVIQDAYNMALQDSKFALHEVQELMEPVNKRSIVHKCLNDKVTKQVQYLIQSTFGTTFVHPHPYNALLSSNIHNFKCEDGLLFDPKFLFSLLMTSRWFARVCMREEHAVSNFHANLLLYGYPGTGKTLITSAISKWIPSYKYLDSRFQNPDMLKSSLIILEECKTSQLPSNHFKELLDIKAAVKIDFKNIHPENVSESVPCIIATNDDVITALRNERGFTKSSIDAALRRLYLVPMKMGQFEKLHGNLQPGSKYFQTLCRFECRFRQQPERLNLLFNLIFAFGLYQQDLDNFYLDPRLHQFITKIVNGFRQTSFCSFYIKNKSNVDTIIRNIEKTMMKEDINETEYSQEFQQSVGQFQQLIINFYDEMSRGDSEIDMDLMRDTSVPWPLKYYYANNSQRFIAKQMWLLSDRQTEFLNQEISQFIENPNVRPFTFPIESESAVENGSVYEEIKVPLDSSDEDLSQRFLEEEKGSYSFQSPVTVADPIDDFNIDIDQFLVGRKRTFLEEFGHDKTTDNQSLLMFNSSNEIQDYSQ